MAGRIRRIRVIHEVRSDYEPASWNAEDIYKVFTAMDALALAIALQAYLDNQFGGKDIGNEQHDAPSVDENAQVEYNSVKAFISFLLKGDFIFVWDD